MELTNILTKEPREGIMATPAFQVPEKTKGLYIFKAMLDTIDLRDTKLVLTVDIDISDDGVTWRYFGGIVYKGGIYEREAMPGFGIYEGATIANKYIRIRLETNKRMPLGAEIEHEKIEAVRL